MTRISDSDATKLVSLGNEFQDLYFLFSRARHAVFRGREKALQTPSLTPEQVELIFVAQALGNKGKPADLARILFRAPHTISAITSRMKKRGLVRKIRDENQKNCVRVIVTKKGKKAAAATLETDPIYRILGILNEAEREQFHDYLSRILTKASDELGLKHYNSQSSN
jgi:DNA-binding MarR family transcriptional regulator